jgi:ABC-2 type transport system permease protein
MSKLRAFVAKEFKHIVRDRWTMMILLALPVIMIVLFGFAISTDLKEARFAVLYPHGEEPGGSLNGRQANNRRIADRLDASPYFRLVAEFHSEAEMDEAFRQGGISLGVIFGDGQVALVADGTEPNTAATIVNYATAIIASSSAQASAAPVQVQYRIDQTTRLLYNPQMKSAYNFVPGVMGMILLLICAMMTSISIAREKEKGTIEVLLVSPMNPLLVVISKAVPYLALSLVNLATILLLSVYVLGVPISGSLFWLLVTSFVYIFASLALGLLISSAVNSQMVALLISGMGLMLPTILLSGMMFPVDQMPAPLQWLSSLIPARWYIAAVRKLMVKGLGLGAVLQELGVLVAMAVGLTAAGIGKFKVRLE